MFQQIGPLADLLDRRDPTGNEGGRFCTVANIETPSRAGQTRTHIGVSNVTEPARASRVGFLVINGDTNANSESTANCRLR
jgi:hypothetical protein